MLETAINDYKIIYIVWNLLLLLIPFFLFQAIKSAYGPAKPDSVWKKIYSAVLYFLWIIFVPNSAYIMTEIRHLLDFCPNNEFHICAESAWMIIVFFSYGVLGWVTFVYYVHGMKVFLREKYGLFAAKIYTFAVIPAISVGMLLGLINRYNSWDIFIRPLEIFCQAVLYIYIPPYSTDFIVFTLFLYLLYFAGEKLFYFSAGKK